MLNTILKMADSELDHRRDLYAEGAAVLDEDFHVEGAEALFDQALTNGLLAIAAAYIPGQLAADTAKKQPSASALLTQLGERVGITGGVAQIPTGRRAQQFNERTSSMETLDHEELVPLHIDQLRDALRRTQAARHGRGPGEQVTPEDVQALLALDKHPALGVLAGHYLDRDWRRAQIDDRAEQARAADYLALLHEEEADRRGQHAEMILSLTLGIQVTSPSSRKTAQCATDRPCKAPMVTTSVTASPLALAWSVPTDAVTGSPPSWAWTWSGISAGRASSGPGWLRCNLN